MALSRLLLGVTEEGYSVNVLAKSRRQVIVKIDFVALGDYLELGPQIFAHGRWSQLSC